MKTFILVLLILVHVEVSMSNQVNQVNQVSEVEIKYQDYELVFNNEMSILFNSPSEEELFFKNKFSEKIKDFEPDFNQKIRLISSNDLVFYDEILNIPKTISFIFNLYGSSQSKVCIIIRNPKDELIFSYCGLRYIFDIEINSEGIYKIVLKNMSKHNKPYVELMYSSLKTKVISRSDIEKPKRIINDTKKLLDNFSHHFKLKSGANKERYKSKL